MSNDTVAARFWVKVDATGDCWEWTASLDTSGYGIFRDGGLVKAHRWAWMNLVGPIPDGLVIDHLCRNIVCVNPDHLRVVTRDTNTLAGYGYSGRNRRATHCPQGHPYSPDNIYIKPSQPGSRRCLTCTRTQNREAIRRRRRQS